MTLSRVDGRYVLTDDGVHDLHASTVRDVAALLVEGVTASVLRLADALTRAAGRCEP